MWLLIILLFSGDITVVEFNTKAACSVASIRLAEAATEQLKAGIHPQVEYAVCVAKGGV